MSTYRRVTAEDRFKLKTYLDAGLTQSEAAVKLGFNKSTISRELRRNTGGRGYRHKQAQRLSQERQVWRAAPRKMDKRMVKTINRLLGRKWSPQQISERLRFEGQESVCYETIYQHVYANFKSGGTLFTNLRFSHRTRKPRFPRRNKDRRGVIKNAISIENRSPGANNRSRFGHWERDTMFGKDKRNSVLLIADRKSRFIKLGKLSRRTAQLTLQKTKELLRRLPRKSMTNDRGKEFTDHEQLTKDLGLPVYFCHPYTSSERGTAENRIGVIRQYLPKGSNLKTLKHKSLKIIEWELNNRPMKCLDWRTPYEVLFGKFVALTT
jgi:IS30 family transposase